MPVTAEHAINAEAVMVAPSATHQSEIRIPRQSHQDKRSLRIGSIEVVVTPPAPPIYRPPAAAQPTAPLSRGFTAAYGLKQG
jgi:hypothetical protein